MRWLEFGIWGLIVLAPGAARALDARDIERAQREQGGATWKAGRSPLKRSGIPVVPSMEFLDGVKDEELQTGQGFRPSSEAFARSQEEQPSFRVALPAKFDWRDIGGVSFSTPVVAQGECGSCVAFAAASTLEMQLGIACNTPAAPFLMSRQYLFSCGGGTCRGGWLLSQAVEFVSQNGVPDEPCLPYVSGLTGEDVLCSRACGDASQRAIRPFSIERPTTGFIDISAIKNALMKGPLLSSMILYADLEFFKDGVYRYTTGNRLGSHAVSIVGWDDSDQSWIVRNSWGEGWGDRGYFKVAWNDPNVLLGRYTWLFNVANAVVDGVCNRPR